MDADVLIPNIIGNITSYSARKNIFDIDMAFKDLYNNSKKYLKTKQTSFEKETRNKLHNLKESR